MSRGDGASYPSRTWGFWTEHKLSMLSEYLTAFTTASKRSPSTLYLDLFAGRVRNISRTTGKTIDGSPRVALNTSPPFSKAVMFELAPQAQQLRNELTEFYPGRDFEVIKGDCNERIAPVLQRLTRDDWSWAPTFVLLDQQAAEIKWTTLDQISRFKLRGKPKAELWLLFAPSMLPRGLVNKDSSAVARFASRITAMYGCDDWLDPYTAKKRELMSPAELRDELLNLMRWRLEKVLGYRATHSFVMRNTGGSEIYRMVFATDHEAGERIMKAIYGNAAKAQPQMRAEATARLQARKEAESNAPGLFPPPRRPVKDVDLYQHEPPYEPYRLPDGHQRLVYP
jgi:three-Cys-motif partner protein